MVGSGGADKFQLINQQNAVVFSGNVKAIETKTARLIN
jgi:lipopolysaccharide export system protein LptA